MFLIEYLFISSWLDRANCLNFTLYHRCFIDKIVFSKCWIVSRRRHEYCKVVECFKQNRHFMSSLLPFLFETLKYFMNVPYLQNRDRFLSIRCLKRVRLFVSCVDFELNLIFYRLRILIVRIFVWYARLADFVVSLIQLETNVDVSIAILNKSDDLWR